MWRNPLTDGTTTISIDWISLIDSKPELVLFTFHHFKTDSEVALIVESVDVGSLAEYARRQPNAQGFRWEAPLWELMREENGRDVYYAAFDVEGYADEWPPSYVEIRVWRDQKGAVWTSGIRCTSTDAHVVAEARELVGALEGTVTDPRNSAEAPPLDTEPT